MNPWLIAALIAYAVIALWAWSICRIAARSDEAAERAHQTWKAGQP